MSRPARETGMGKILTFPTLIITQAELRAVIDDPQRWDLDIQKRLIAGERVEPGPLIAFLIHYKPNRRRKHGCHGVRIRERRGR